MSAAKLTRRLALATLTVAAVLSPAAAGQAAPAHAVARRPDQTQAPDYVPGKVVVGYAPSHGAVAQIAHATRAIGAHAVAGAGAGAATETGAEARAGTVAGAANAGAALTGAEGIEVVKVAHGHNIWQAIAQLRRRPGVLYAVPDYIAHQAGGWVPDDRGNTRRAQGWESVQWNFLAGAGVDAPDAWAHMFGYHRPGGRGVVIAVLDTGVAYRNWEQFRKSPDFAGTQFVDPYDFVANDPYPLDREGHGTFVAGMLAEATNNKIGLTGLAYGSKIMPVRVLDADGNGDSATIARGIRYAVTHGAQVINLSLEFDITVTGSEIPDIISAIRFAHRHGVVVVAAAGNDSALHLAYPAAAPAVISVGATTLDRCIAAYSNSGAKLDLVAPGGGDDANLTNDPNCHPLRNLPAVHQMTFRDFDSITPGSNPTRFSLPGSYGTSMAAPEVSATAALVIASRILGRHPTPDAILARLEQTATPLGGTQPNPDYGYGLINAGAATAR